MQSTGFVLDPAGRIVVSVYSSGAIGRLVPQDVIGLIGCRHPLQTVSTPGPPLTIDGKPAIVFASEESCPFCAAERQPLVVALANSGSWSHLGSTKPSATDVYPDTATLSSRAARNSLCEPPSSPTTSGAP